MRYVIFLKSKCRYVRQVDNDEQIVFFDSYGKAQDEAGNYGADAAILEVNAGGFVFWKQEASHA